MPPVFAHGRLRLYLLKLLDEAPRHGYEVIRLLEERFQGLYAPSAGTVYPRLAKLEAEGLVTHTTEGGRKVYAITEAGRAELAGRGGELADLELEIRDSVAELAAEIRDGVQGAAGDLRREMRAAADEARASGGGAGTGEASSAPSDPFGGAWGDKDGWRKAKEEFNRAKQEWKEQARRAKDESRRARDEAQRARRQAKEAQEKARVLAQEEAERIAQRVQEQVRDHFTRGDWPAGVRESLTELAKGLGEFGVDLGKHFPYASGPASGTECGAERGTDSGAGTKPDSGPDTKADPKASPDPGGRPASATAPQTAPGTGGPEFSAAPEDLIVEYIPDWAREEPSGDPARDLDRLLDRFRDDIRDAARDHGVTEEQLREARSHLSAAAAHIGATLHPRKR
ncbi:PadR family transcriptional regulator [Streptomyces sp. BG9H]|uniref:PadR family transcriptional regulator n=1 Tax=Streptomyces anatolicus TaxID=2675858 RepID=A0ABS6YVE5_9ACTN|nr:PadR family transcriptional regulator [Streptomyces anatolicus]MBW5425408.1 PadR family transcriptional regulator [Streptomyces anatolicus]